MARIEPLSENELLQKNVDLSFIGSEFHELPNSVPTLAYRPDILKAAGALFNSVMGEGLVDPGLKWLVGYMSSMAAGCRYCSAHTAAGGVSVGLPTEKIEAVWEFQSSPLFSDAERAALHMALGAGQVPNAVEDEDFEALKAHFSIEQIVELVAVVGVYGFFNRWNDTIKTQLETTPLRFAEKHLKQHGWEIGSHK